MSIFSICQYRVYFEDIRTSCHDDFVVKSPQNRKFWDPTF